MNKKLVLGGVIIIMLLSLFSCGSDKHPSELVGVWETQNGRAYLELIADGTAIESNDFGTFERTWSASNGEFCLTSEEGFSTCGKYTLSGKGLTWEFNALGTDMKVDYIKLPDEEADKHSNELDGYSKFGASKFSNDKNSLVGTWSLKYNNGDLIDGKSILKFMPDGTAESITYGTDIEAAKEGDKEIGLWTYCDDQLYTVFRTGSEITCVDFYSIEGSFHLAGNEFIWYRWLEGETIILTFERK